MEDMMKKELFITQKPREYNGIIDYSYCDIIFMVKTDDNGQLEYYVRDLIGNWKRVTDESELDHLKQAEPISLTPYLEKKYPNGFSMQKFQRTKSLFNDEYENKSYCNTPTIVIAELPNGALLELSEFVFSDCSRDPKLPVSVISSRYTKDGNYTLEDLGIHFGHAIPLGISLTHDASKAESSTSHEDGSSESE